MFSVLVNCWTITVATYVVTYENLVYQTVGTHKPPRCLCDGLLASQEIQRQDKAKLLPGNSETLLRNVSKFLKLSLLYKVRVLRSIVKEGNFVIDV
jgi:hypothetical protein